MLLLVPFAPIAHQLMWLQARSANPAGKIVRFKLTPPLRLILRGPSRIIFESERREAHSHVPSSLRALRIVLRIFSLLLLVGGVFMILASKPLVMRVFLRPPESEVSTLLLFVLKEMGGFVLMLTLMLFFASRDPIRNVAIVDAVIAGLVVLAVTPLLSLYSVEIQKIYPTYLVWGRSLVRLAIAALLYLLKPREKSSGPVGGF